MIGAVGELHGMIDLEKSGVSRQERAQVEGDLGKLTIYRQTRSQIPATRVTFTFESVSRSRPGFPIRGTKSGTIRSGHHPNHCHVTEEHPWTT